MDKLTQQRLKAWAEKYNDRQYFATDPINFPRIFAEKMVSGKAELQDVEIAGIFAAHLAWGRRSMIVRDCERLFEEMKWEPYAYIMEGVWRSDETSLHRTIKWREIAAICKNLREIYSHAGSIEQMSVPEIRKYIFGARDDTSAANKKINMMRRWFVRDDGKVDLGIWSDTSKRELLIPLDVHVHQSAAMLGLTSRKSADMRTVMEITEAFREIFPDDPCLGDFALFGYGVTGGK